MIDRCDRSALKDRFEKPFQRFTPTRSGEDVDVVAEGDHGVTPLGHALRGSKSRLKIEPQNPNGGRPRILSHGT
jgi:hypothetical protein